VLALGLPAAGEAFDRGSFLQHLELPGAWLDRGRLRAADALLLDGPLGLAGHRVLGTLWLAAGQPQVLVLRLLADRVEPAMRLLQAVRGAWRRSAWGLDAEPPRVWRT
jgi:urease accessory protein